MFLTLFSRLIRGGGARGLIRGDQVSFGENKTHPVTTKLIREEQNLSMEKNSSGENKNYPVKTKLIREEQNSSGQIETQPHPGRTKVIHGEQIIIGE